MNADILEKLTSLYTHIPVKSDTGYNHSDLFYGIGRGIHPLYLGCILYDITKEESKGKHYPRIYLYIIEQFEKKHFKSTINPELQMSHKIRTEPHSIYLGYMPACDIAKKYIKNGSTFLSWTNDTRIFTIINMAPEPTKYEHLPGIFNEFINEEKDPYLISLADTIMSSRPSVSNPYIFKGLNLLKKNIGLWHLTEIYNNINQFKYKDKNHLIIRFIGRYRQNHATSSRIEIHLTFAPNSTENTLKNLTEDKFTSTSKTMMPAARKIIASHHNLESGCLIEVCNPEFRPQSKLQDEVENILKDAISYVDEHMKKKIHTNSQTN